MFKRNIRVEYLSGILIDPVEENLDHYNFLQSIGDIKRQYNRLYGYINELQFV